MSSSSLKRLAFALALTGLAGTISVLAAPRVAPPGKKLAQKPKSQKPSQPATRTLKSAKVPATSTSHVILKGGPTTNAMKAPQPTGDTNTDTTTEVSRTLDEQGFTPSQYSGVVVRNVPGPSAQIISEEASDGPILFNERPAPGGGMMSDVRFPREVETIDALATKETTTETEQATSKTQILEQIAAPTTSLPQATIPREAVTLNKFTQPTLKKAASKPSPKR